MLDPGCEATKSQYLITLANVDGSGEHDDDCPDMPKSRVVALASLIRGIDFQGPHTEQGRELLVWAILQLVRLWVEASTTSEATAMYVLSSLFLFKYCWTHIELEKNWLLQDWEEKWEEIGRRMNAFVRLEFCFCRACSGSATVTWS